MMHTRKRNAGFTLLELLVALAIMAMALGMIYRSAGGSASSVGAMAQSQHATTLVDSLLTMRDTVPEDGWNESGESAGFSWVIASAPYPTAVTDTAATPLHEILIRVSWSEGGRPKQLQVSTLRPQRKPLPGGNLR